jgi:hypothetical protein
LSRFDTRYRIVLHQNLASRFRYRYHHLGSLAELFALGKMHLSHLAMVVYDRCTGEALVYLYTRQDLPSRTWSELAGTAVSLIPLLLKFFDHK